MEHHNRRASVWVDPIKETPHAPGNHSPLPRTFHDRLRRGAVVRDRNLDYLRDLEAAGSLVRLQAIHTQATHIAERMLANVCWREDIERIAEIVAVVIAQKFDRRKRRDANRANFS
jgi:hypothetical protein